MKIVVINGTELKGCTYQIKEIFLSVLREGNEITEFYLPKDLPHFCTGCKTCFISLLDHFCCHWMVHRPDKAMFTKRAIILTKSIGAPSAIVALDKCPTTS